MIFEVFSTTQAECDIKAYSWKSLDYLPSNSITRCPLSLSYYCTTALPISDLLRKL